MTTKKNHIFIGWDNREVIASIVAKYSMSLHLKNEDDCSIEFLNRRSLQTQHLYYRKAFLSENGQYFDTLDSKPFSTEFSFSRFLVPELCRIQQKDGWAMFVDGDFLFLDDIMKLFSCVNNKYSVMCIKFNWVPPQEERYKLDGMIQPRYSKKLWSSLMMFNLNHPHIKKLNRDLVNTSTGSHLHKFRWTDKESIGFLPEEWNYVDGVTSKSLKPKAIHYTKGGPWFENYRDCKFSDEWINCLQEMPKNFLINNMVD